MLGIYIYGIYIICIDEDIEYISRKRQTLCKILSDVVTKANSLGDFFGFYL